MMNPETQGKLMVAMIISVLAFGFGTTAVLLTGHYQNINTVSTLNTTQQSDFPVVPNNQNSLNTSTQSSSQQNNNSYNPNNNKNNSSTTR